MTSESSELDYSPSEDVESKKFEKGFDGCSDSGASDYLTASCGLSSKESEAEVDDVAVTDLGTSDENLHGFDTKLGSFGSLKGTSNGDLTRTTKSSGLTKNDSSLKRLLSKRASSLNPLNGPSTRRVSSVDPLEGPSTRRVWSVDPLEGHSTRRIMSVDPLEGPSTSKIESLDPLEGPSTRTVYLSNSAVGSLTSTCNLPNSESETNEPSNSETTTDQTECFRMLTWLRNFSRPYSRQITHSKYYLWFHLALLILPCSTAYMGSKYYNLCEGCALLASQVYWMGLLGMIVLSVRIASMLSKHYFSPHLTGNELILLQRLMLLAFLLFLLCVAFSLHICKPVFIPRKSDIKKFCVKEFYNYAYYLNVVVSSAVFPLLLVELPGCFDREEEAAE